MFTFNGIDALTMVTKVTDVRRQVLPPVETVLQEIAGMDGAHRVKKNLKPRYIEIDITVRGIDREDLMSKVELLGGWLYTDGAKALTFTDEPDRIYYGELTANTDLEEINKTGKATLTFVCVDPLKYKTVSKSANFNAGTATISNLGSYWTPCLFTINFSGSRTSIKISLNSTIYVLITRNFIAGDVLTINSKNGKVQLNGVNIGATMNFASRLGEMNAAKGSTTFTLDSVTGISSAKVDITERWL